ELHAHLNGSLSPSSLRKLGCLEEDIAKYQKLTKLLHTTEKTLNECFELFRVAQDATNNKQSVYFATQSVIEDFYNDNVIYLELRTTPRQERDMTKADYIESVVEAIQDCTQNIIVKLLLSIDRRLELNSVEETMKLFIKMKNKYPNIIKGVDFSGNPNLGCFNKNLFKQAVDNGFFVTLHCGEVKHDSEVVEILNFKPHRIGHGIFLHPSFGGSDEIWSLYCQTKIPLECCLTSNVLCGTRKSYKKHHLQEWINSSLPFTLCTDDKGIFCTSLSRELLLAATHLNLNSRDLWQISFNSIDYTFASDEEKNFLQGILMDWKLKNHI
ncbi:adenosine deaminase-like protein, partial [Asbolus verrucosus]